MKFNKTNNPKSIENAQLLTAPWKKWRACAFKQKFCANFGA
jgi:hypothetical protein